MESIDVVHAKARRAYNLVAQRYHELFRNELDRKPYDRNLLDIFAGRFAGGSMVCDAGCGPSAHIGRYLYNRGINVVGVDISDECVEIARRSNPRMRIHRGDIAKLGFEAGPFDGVISYYSIIHTPKHYVPDIFSEFNRVLKPGGSLLVAVKEGAHDGYVGELLEIKTEIYFSLFSENEIVRYFEQSGFLLEFIEERKPYDFEIRDELIFAIGRKSREVGL